MNTSRSKQNPPSGANNDPHTSKGVQQSRSHTTSNSIVNPSGPSNFSGRFNSQVFSITVGETKPDFMAHASILSQSPVLAIMCKGPYMETANGHINLPDNDAEIFGYFLEYLYTGSLPSQNTSSLDHGLKLASLYTLSDKYQLKVLKEKIVKIMETDLSISGDCDVFFPVMHQMFEGVTRADKDFHDYFHRMAFRALKNMNEDEYKNLRKMLSREKPLIKNIVNTQRLLCRVLAGSEDFWKTRYEEVKTENEKALSKLKDREESLADLKDQLRATKRVRYG